MGHRPKGRTPLARPEGRASARSADSRVRANRRVAYRRPKQVRTRSNELRVLEWTSPCLRRHTSSTNPDCRTFGEIRERRRPCSSSERTAAGGFSEGDAAVGEMPSLPDRVRDLPALRPRARLLQPTLLGRSPLAEPTVRAPPSPQEPRRSARPPRPGAQPPPTSTPRGASRGGSPFRDCHCVCQCRVAPDCDKPHGALAPVVPRSDIPGDSTSCASLLTAPR